MDRLSLLFEEETDYTEEALESFLYNLYLSVMINYLLGLKFYLKGHV